MVVLLKEIDTFLFSMNQALLAPGVLAHTKRAVSVQEVRLSLKALLLAGQIPLRRYMRAVGAVSSKMDRKYKKKLQIEREAASGEAANNV